MACVLLPPSMLQQRMQHVAYQQQLQQQHHRASLQQPVMREPMLRVAQPHRPVRATVIHGDAHGISATAAMAACSLSAAASSPVPAALPVAAHVIADAAENELIQRLQSRLTTLGLGATAVKVEVRANDAPATALNGRSFTLTLSGRLPLNLGSLFNILIAQFHKQHSQITNVDRKVAFITAANAASSSLAAGALTRARSGNDAPMLEEDDETPIVDSPPLLALKIRHLAKLMIDHPNTVVYTGDHLCQTHVASAAAATDFNSVPVTDLLAPNPPALLADWVRTGRISHIINENTDGFFNSLRRACDRRASSAAVSSAAVPAVCASFASRSLRRHPRNMSDEDDDSSCDSDEDGSSSSASSNASSRHSSMTLPAEHLSELFGNKYQEVCSAGCGQPGLPGNACVFTRDFEVQLRQAPLRIRPAGASVPPLANGSAADSHLTGRSCWYCSAPLRDTLVGWNESLPRALLQRCVAQASQAELSLVLGSRLQVSPLNELPALAGPSAPLVIVQASTTAKDAECLEAGGILIRATPTVVLAKLDAELKRLRKQAVAQTLPNAMPAIVRKAAPPTSIPSSMQPPVRAISMRPASSHLATALLRRNLKKRSVSMQSPSALALFSQRRGAPRNHGPASSGLDRPSMLRAATAAPSLLSMDAKSAAALRQSMQLSASLPPFPSLDDESDNEVPAASAPTRACSEDATGRGNYDLQREHSMHNASLILAMPPRTSSVTSSCGDGLPALPSACSSRAGGEFASADSLLPPPLLIHSPMPFAPQTPSPPLALHMDNSMDEQ